MGEPTAVLDIAEADELEEAPAGATGSMGDSRAFLRALVVILLAALAPLGVEVAVIASRSAPALVASAAVQRPAWLATSVAGLAGVAMVVMCMAVLSVHTGSVRWASRAVDLLRVESIAVLAVLALALI
ncbi:hypothetical protein GCM10009551_054360 [Nocardiopsis tropica]|uniref:hypothetical protein n=1 Tax=Tsukamurella strandjordii TaxID=147577 RepID=UPI0031D15E59